MEAERRWYPIEYRAGAGGGAGPVLEGTVPYDSIGLAPGGVRELFESGSLDAMADDLILTRDHDRSLPLARTGGGGLEVEAKPDGLHVRAELADTTLGRDTLELVKAKVLRGLSPEFVAVEASMAGGVRRIRKARLVGLSVVDTPAYPEAEVEARAEAKWTPRLWV